MNTVAEKLTALLTANAVPDAAAVAQRFVDENMPCERFPEQPISRVRWMHRDILTANDYNPNKVAPPELKLLEISIIEDGWTQPIVITPDNRIVDGFHRWTVSGKTAVYTMTGGFVPVAMLAPRDRSSLQMSTIRHNRARGTHAVLNMANIVQEMVGAKKCIEEIMERLGMELEEVIRLAARVGIPKSDIVSNSGWSKSWVPTDKTPPA